MEVARSPDSRVSVKLTTSTVRQTRSASTARRNRNTSIATIYRTREAVPASAATAKRWDLDPLPMPPRSAQDRCLSFGGKQMKIVAVETWHTRIPFDMGAKPVAVGGVGWQFMNTLWVRIVTDQGLEGWGEGFGHASCQATRAVVDTQLAPALLGQDARDIAGLRARLSKMFHLYGRNGPHIYALSALDIALWD